MPPHISRNTHAINEHRKTSPPQWPRQFIQIECRIYWLNWHRQTKSAPPWLFVIIFVCFCFGALGWNGLSTGILRVLAVAISCVASCCVIYVRSATILCRRGSCAGRCWARQHGWHFCINFAVDQPQWVFVFNAGKYLETYFLSFPFSTLFGLRFYPYASHFIHFNWTSSIWKCSRVYRRLQSQRRR